MGPIANFWLLILLSPFPLFLPTYLLTSCLFPFRRCSAVDGAPQLRRLRLRRQRCRGVRPVRPLHPRLRRGSVPHRGDRGHQRDRASEKAGMNQL